MTNKEKHKMHGSKPSASVWKNSQYGRTILNEILHPRSSGGSRIFEKGGRGNGKVTLGLIRLNINV